MMLSQRAAHLKPSPTLALSTKSKELAAAGFDVINLTVGEPDWNTPKVACDAGIIAIQNGFTKYTPVAGIPELRSAIAQITSREIGIDFKPNQVAVGAGAKFVIAAAMQMLLNEGDEVIIPTPYWVSYPSMAELAGATPRIVHCGPESKFKLQPAQLETAIQEKTRMLILCSPSNPTGLMYSNDELTALAQVLRRHPQVVILSDDIYNHLVFNQEPLAPHLLRIAPDLKERVILVNGASKTFSMTGWRVGWALGPAEFISTLSDYFSQTTSNLASMAQKATIAALENQDAIVAEARSLLMKRMDTGFSELQKIPGLELFRPDGAFYFWVGIRSYFQKKDSRGQLIRDSKDFTKALLEQKYVAAVPGAEFGSEGYLRLSFAIQEQTFQQAAGRLREFCASLV